MRAKGCALRRAVIVTRRKRGALPSRAARRRLVSSRTALLAASRAAAMAVLLPCTMLPPVAKPMPARQHLLPRRSRVHPGTQKLRSEVQRRRGSVREEGQRAVRQRIKACFPLFLFLLCLQDACPRGGGYARCAAYEACASRC